MKKRFHVWIQGLVKGVFFRAGVKDMADKLNIKGFVRNTDDGIEAVFEGNSQDIEKMIEFCRKGPKYAQVVKADVKEENYAAEFSEFKVLHF
jgi:acylphosphatase